MEQENVGLYLGMDISEKYTMISIYQQHMKEPQTISTIMGSESYQIPTALAKKKRALVSGSSDAKQKCVLNPGSAWRRTSS